MFLGGPQKSDGPGRACNKQKVKAKKLCDQDVKLKAFNIIFNIIEDQEQACHSYML